MTTDTMTKAEAAGGRERIRPHAAQGADIARSERFYVDLLGFKIAPGKAACPTAGRSCRSRKGSR